jgi:hypothetical protein
VYIRLPNNSAVTWNRYFAPFSYGFWLAVAIAACALSVCMALTTCGRERKQGRTVPAVFFYIHACFCQQGQTDEFAFVLLTLCPFFLLYSYNIVSFSSSIMLKFIPSVFRILPCCPSQNRFYLPNLIPHSSDCPISCTSLLTSL